MTAGFAAAEGPLGGAVLALQGLEGVSPVSGIPVAILAGMALNNTVTLPDSLRPGFKFASTQLLRAGIICVGAKLSAVEMVSLGALGVPVVATSIATGLAFTLWLGNRLDMPRRMTTLIAAGTSICGVTAITAVAPVIKANQQEVSFAVANVVAFGTLGMLCYPYLAHGVLDSSVQIGTFLGLAIHDTSQVMGAALTYDSVYVDEVVLKTAAVTKLTRNLFLAGVIPLLGMREAKLLRQENASSADAAAAAAAPKPSARDRLAQVTDHIPTFVLGFIGMSLLRSTGDGMLAHDMLALGVFDAESWVANAKILGNVIGGHYLLGTAMAAVGLNTNVKTLRAVGLKPFAVGLAGATCVGGTAFTCVSVLGAAGLM